MKPLPPLETKIKTAALNNAAEGFPGPIPNTSGATGKAAAARAADLISKRRRPKQG